MRKLLLATAAAVVFATPAIAKDNSGYIGLEGGVLFPKDPSGGTVDVVFTTTQTPADPVGPPGPANATFTNVFGNINAKTGYDIDLIGGYDFGMFRIEGELGYKHSKLDADTADTAFLTALNTALNRPSADPDTGFPGLAALTAADFDLIDEKVKVWSGMVNGLLDFGGEGGIGAYVGAGAGYANVKAFGESKGKFAWQVLAGAYMPVSPNIDIGVKGRYFQTGRISSNDVLAFSGNPNTIAVDTPGGPVLIDQTTNAVLSTGSHVKFKSYSVLLSLVYNFGAAEPPPPPPPPAPPPPPPPPATQTCPDGSVIDATATCPPPPPPPPPPPVERGERGE